MGNFSSIHFMNMIIYLLCMLYQVWIIIFNEMLAMFSYRYTIVHAKTGWYIKAWKIKSLPDGELNPGLPRDRRGYLPLYYRGLDISKQGLNMICDSNFLYWIWFIWSIPRAIVIKTKIRIQYILVFVNEWIVYLIIRFSTVTIIQFIFL